MHLLDHSLNSNFLIESEYNFKNFLLKNAKSGIFIPKQNSQSSIYINTLKVKKIK